MRLTPDSILGQETLCYTGDSHTLGVHLCVAVSALDWGYRVELKRVHVTD